MGSAAKEFFENRVMWRSEWSFIIVTAAAVIGIGNLWLFPTMIHRYGGGFVLLYFAALILVGFPAMMAEMILGQQARLNQVDAFWLLSYETGKSLKWTYLGWFSAVTLLLILSFYSVISSFSLAYAYHFATGAFSNLLPAGAVKSWHQFLANPKDLLLWHSILVLITVGVIARGIRHGLELLSYVAMAALFTLLLVMAYLAITSSHLSFTFQQLWHFSPALFSWAGILAALSYAFFSLSVGAGVMLVYGSYLPLKGSLTRSICTIIFLDFLASGLAFIALDPWIFSRISAGSKGLGILFESLVCHVGSSTHCRIEGTLFYIVVFLAAWTSLIALVEPLTIIIIEKFQIARLKASAIAGVLFWLLGVGTILSFNLWKHYKIFNRWNYFDVLSGLSTEVMLPLGALGFCIYAGWILPRDRAEEEIGASRHRVAYHIWLFLVRYFAPLGIALILIGNLLKAL